MPPRSSKRSAAAAAAAAKAKSETEEEVVVDAAVPPTDEVEVALPEPPVEEEDVQVKDPLAEQHVDQEAALEAAEAAIGNVLDDVNVDNADDDDDGAVDATGEGDDDEEDEVAMAAAAAAAAVDASDGMAVVVDQALLATAAAAAASQVAKLLSEQPEVSEGLPQDVFPGNKGGGGVAVDDLGEDGDLLEARRVKDRKRYSAMTPEARSAYNAHRRELYHKQGEAARKRRRERERDRYHSLEGEDKKQRNERRAKLERDRYNKLDKDELAARNLRRRERAKARKSLTKTLAGGGGSGATTTGAVDEDVKIGHPDYAMEDVAMADASALAAEVAEQVIANSNLDASASAVQALLEEGPTVEI